MTQVLPAIIPQTREQMETEIKKVSSFAKLIQIDISDGLFTPVKTWPFNGRDTLYFENLKNESEGLLYWDDIDYEFHLMIQNPEDYVESFIHAGASTIIVQIEAVNDFNKIYEICRDNEVSIGVAIKPKTNIEKIKEIGDRIDFIQVMGADKLGNHGVSLDTGSIEKLKELRILYPDKVIAIDIGVNEETKDMLVQAGANKLISGSAILDSANPEEVYNSLSHN